MVLVMTTTNHPPFDLPDNINLSELPDSFYDNKCFENVGKDVLGSVSLSVSEMW